MTFEVEIEIRNEELLAAFRRLEATARDMKPAMERIGRYLEASTRLRFRDQTGPDGERWPPSRRAIEQGGRTLVDTGTLRSSITYDAGRDRVEIGTNVPYAPVHQFGATITPKRARYLKFRTPDGGFVQTTRVTVPARPFLGIDDRDEHRILEILEDAIAEAAR